MAYTQYANVATGAANTVVKASAGSLGRLVVTTTGTGAGTVNVFDNATTNSGQIIAAIPSNAAAGTTFQFDAPAHLGIVVANVLNGPVLTVLYD